MNQREALSVLIQAANIAQNKGAFNLQEAQTVATAVSTFITPPETSLEEETDSTEEVND
jgi:hypothetical protein